MDSEHDPLADRFFSSPPLEPDFQADDGSWHVPVSKHNRRAMHVTLWLLASSLVGFGAFLIYAKWIMPTPVELQARGPARLPTPMASPIRSVAPATAPSRPAVEPEQAPEPELTAHVTPVAPTVVSIAPPPPSEAAGRSVRPNARLHVSNHRKVLKGRGSVDALVRRAHRELRRGDHAAAQRSAELAVARAPSRGDAWIVLGAARDADNDVHGAKRAYQRCVQQAVGRFSSTCKRLARR